MQYVLLTIICNVIVFLIEFYFDYRQSKKLQETTTVPEKLAPHIEAREFEEMQTYSLLRLSFSRLESTYGIINEIMSLLCGILVFSNNLANRIMQDVFELGSDYPLVKGVTFLFLVSFYSAVMKAPFEIYRIYVIDSKFFQSAGANQALANWVTDQIILFVLTTVVGTPILALILKLIALREALYWLYVWIGAAACAVIVYELYPLILAPIFNKVTVLPEGELRTKIEKLSRRLGFPVKQIVYIDGSKRSANANAFVMGAGGNKRIVLYDTLFQTLTDDEILAVLAHEMGHYKNAHSTKSILIQVGNLGVFLLGLYLCIYNIDFYRSFGFDTVEPAIGLLCYSYLYHPFGNGLNVISNVLHRHFEYMCDAYAMDMGYDMEQPLIKMHVNNVFNIVVDKHYSRYYNEHPSLMERLEEIEEYRMHKMLHAKIHQRIYSQASSSSLQDSPHVSRVDSLASLNGDSDCEDNNSQYSMSRHPSELDLTLDQHERESISSMESCDNGKPENVKLKED